MRLIIETGQPLSQTEAQILRYLLSAYGDLGKTEAPAEKAPAEKAPAKKAPAKKAPAKTEDPEGSETPEVDEAVLNEAIDSATEMISQGKASQVKKALASVGIPKVGAIETTEQAKQFLDALK